MIAIEDQVRRYATDVAGPAIAAPPADLAQVGSHQSHRGRWLLVAALVLFVIGLTAVAVIARPTDESEAPSVATEPPLPQVESIVSRAVGTGACTADGSVTGVLLEGSAADGLCVSSLPVPEQGPDATRVGIYQNGELLWSWVLVPCTNPDFQGKSPFPITLPDGEYVMVAIVPSEVSYVVLDNDLNALAPNYVPSDPGPDVGPDPGPTAVPFDVDGIRLGRLAVARATDVSDVASPARLDANRRILPMRADMIACTNN
ncbi:MAG TPA: hypothetical protein VIY72_17425 [Acidimicrobiales bacterium]